MTGGVMRIGAVADVHYGRDADSRLRPYFEEAGRHVDVLILAGDLTDYGLPEEARPLAADLAAVVRVPVVAVLGNHDYESGKEVEVTAVLRDAGVKVLDGDVCEFGGVGFAGVKGFGGGFGRGTLEPWGEAGVKRFVRESVEEALKLERALARLQTPVKIAVTHYAPIRATVAGEPEEIFPYMGTGRLEEPMNRYGVTAAVHGHAHRGAAEGKTATGVPVYNVALPVLKTVYPGGLPLRVIEVPVSPTDPADAGVSAAYTTPATLKLTNQA